MSARGGKCRPSPRPPRLAELDAAEEKQLERERGERGAGGGRGTGEPQGDGRDVRKPDARRR